MKWKRCKICGDLKQENEFYENRKVCKTCMKQRYFLDKNKKKEYDKQRYLNNKENKKEKKHICMRCGNYYANVKNNELEWCFHCLRHYEEIYGEKIKVEVILPYYKKVKNV